MPYCDLHMHSTASDGSDAPEHLARLAKDAGLEAFALTDHDTTAGLPAAAAAAKRLRITFIPGIELSADPDVLGVGESHGTLHLLGYHVRHDDEHLLRIQERLREARAQRNPEMVSKLNELGVEITYDEVVREAGGEQDEQTIVGRPHIAQVMVKKGYARSVHEAFSKYIGMRGAAYIRKDRLSAAEAIEAIHTAGGLVSFAHPVQTGIEDADALEQYIKALKQLGLDAIETRHSDHTPADTTRLEKLAERFDLLTTGGSDYHGSRKSITLGSQRVPSAVAERLSVAVR